MISSRGLVAVLGAGALAIAGYAYGIEEFVLFAFAVLVAFVLGALVLAARALVASRAFQTSVHVPFSEVGMGHLAAAELTLTNIGRRATPPVIAEDPRRHWSISYPGLSGRRAAQAWEARRARGLRRIFGEWRYIGSAVRFSGMSPGATAGARIPIPTSARGLLSLSPLGIWCEDPLRLLAWRVATAPPTHVLVCPIPERTGVPLRPSSPGDGARPTEGGEEEPVANVRGGHEFRSLRPYVPGDRITRLHWPSFARSGELTVRDFVEPVAGCVTLLVDLRPAVYSASSGNSKRTGERNLGLDAVIARAAGVGMNALEDGRMVELCASTGERVEISPGVNSGRRLLQALAVLGPSGPTVSVALRWGQTTHGSAVWASVNRDVSDVVLVTTGAGAHDALPEALAVRADRVVVG